MGAKLLEPLPAAFPRPLLRATPRPRAEARTATAPVMAPPMDAALAGRVFGAEWLPRALLDGVRDGRRLVAPPTPIRDPPPATPPPWWPGPLTELPLQLRAAGADATAGADTLPLLAPPEWASSPVGAGGAAAAPVACPPGAAAAAAPVSCCNSICTRQHAYEGERR